MNAPTPPRRFRFGLRSLFVLVTVACVWLGYSMNWIRQRREFLKMPNVGFTMYGDLEQNPDKRPAPWFLWCLGEDGYAEIYPPVEHQDACHRLFPEAAVLSEPSNLWRGPLITEQF